MPDAHGYPRHFRSAVYDCIARGEIPAKRLGRRVIVVRAALETFLVESDGARRPPPRRTRRLRVIGFTGSRSHGRL